MDSNRDLALKLLREVLDDDAAQKAIGTLESNGFMFVRRLFLEEQEQAQQNLMNRAK